MEAADALRLLSWQAVRRVPRALLRRVVGLDDLVVAVDAVVARRSYQNADGDGRRGGGAVVDGLFARLAVAAGRGVALLLRQLLRSARCCA